MSYDYKVAQVDGLRHGFEESGSSIIMGGDGNIITKVVSKNNSMLENLDYVDEKVVAFHQHLLEMLELYSKKNHDYGDAFSESLDEDGLLVAKIRLGDKFRRFSTLINSDRLVESETIIDTLRDLSNYAIMTAMWYEEREARRVDCE